MPLSMLIVRPVSGLSVAIYTFKQRICILTEERLTAAEAARHPFFASYLPLAFLLPTTSGK